MGTLHLKMSERMRLETQAKMKDGKEGIDVIQVTGSS